MIQDNFKSEQCLACSSPRITYLVGTQPMAVAMCLHPNNGLGGPKCPIHHVAGSASSGGAAGAAGIPQHLRIVPRGGETFQRHQSASHRSTKPAARSQQLHPAAALSGPCRETADGPGRCGVICVWIWAGSHQFRPRRVTRRRSAAAGGHQPTVELPLYCRINRDERGSDPCSNGLHYGRYCRGSRPGVPGGIASSVSTRPAPIRLHREHGELRSVPAIGRQRRSGK